MIEDASEMPRAQEGRSFGSGRSRTPEIGVRPVRIYEGALLFVTEISCHYRDSPYKPESVSYTPLTPLTNYSRTSHCVAGSFTNEH